MLGRTEDMVIMMLNKDKYLLASDLDVQVGRRATPLWNRYRNRNLNGQSVFVWAFMCNLIYQVCPP